MLKTLISISISLYICACNSETSGECEDLNELTNIIRGISLVADSLNWRHIHALKDSVCRNQSPGHTEQFAQLLIKELRKAGDKHSFFISDSLGKLIDSVSKEAVVPTGKVIANNIGYLVVPGFISSYQDQIAKYATTLQNQIREIDERKNIAGWIIDLRENYGGNMWPMIAGLGPILGNGLAGYFEVPINHKRYEWNYTDGKFGSVIVSDFYQVKHPEKPVALLISNRTSSSGEMTVVAFLGKPNVKSFGMPTGGFITANSHFKITDGSVLVLANAYVTDRQGRRYIDSLQPDIKVDFEVDSPVDLAIDSAVKWIQGRR